MLFGSFLVHFVTLNSSTDQRSMGWISTSEKGGFLSLKGVVLYGCIFGYIWILVAKYFRSYGHMVSCSLL